MNRFIEKFLEAWKTDPSRTPLLVRGARQIGKSYTIEKFGKEFFDNCVIIDFDLDPRFIQCFNESLEPEQIIIKLTTLSGQDIIPGKTLLFFDEIQQCPRAIMGLRYFKEKLPELHVIGAGSLLEFALAQKDMRIPVGRVQYLFMYPLSFGEFLCACGYEKAHETIQTLSIDNPPSLPVHEHIISLLRVYLVIGGMPAVVQEYLTHKNINLCQRIQARIVLTYRDDFAKYGTKSELSHLSNIFRSIPKLVGSKFKYSAVDEMARSRELKHALSLLERAGVVYCVKQASGSGLPFEASASETHFKTIFLDVGLMQHLCGAPGEVLLAEDILATHSGAVAEQFVGQELISSADPYLPAALYYWAREARNSNAETDYLVAHNAKIFPLEVKAGTTGSLRSMHLFIETYATEFGIKASQGNLFFDTKVLSIPLYALACLQKLITETSQKISDN